MRVVLLISGANGVTLTSPEKYSGLAGLSVAGCFRNGVQRERLYVAGVSSRNPVASNDTPAGRAQNRRVEIVIRPFTG